MKKSAPPNHQLGFGPMPLGDSEPREAAFRRSEQANEALGKSEQLASEILNAAFDAAGLQNKEIAHLCGVSVSLVEKWRSTEARGCPSFVQLLMLPVNFHWELHKAMDRHFGLGRRALADVISAIGSLAMLAK